MSKVKVIEGINKGKARAALRRKETFAKKRERMEKGANYNGYYIKDEKLVRKTKKVLVSEHTEEKSVLDGFADIVNYKKSADGTVVRVVTKEPKYKKVQEVIPEHVERVHTGYEIVQVPARPVRISRSSAHKFLKKQAARKLRRLPVSEEVGTGASYKRHYDVAWMLD